MAQKVSVVLTDDLDETVGDDIETVMFGLDGVSYEIDLCATNATALRLVLEPYVTAGRRTGGRRQRGAGATVTGRVAPPVATNHRTPQHVPILDGVTTGRGKEQTAAIRQWAIAHGMQVADRGRIAADIVAAFDEAHARPSGKPRGKRSATVDPHFSG